MLVESQQHSTSKGYKNGDSVKIFIVKASVQHTGRNKYWRQTASWEGQLGCYITSAGNHQPQDQYSYNVALLFGQQFSA